MHERMALHFNSPFAPKTASTDGEMSSTPRSMDMPDAFSNISNVFSFLILFNPMGTT